MTKTDGELFDQWLQTDLSKYLVDVGLRKQMQVQKPFLEGRQAWVLSSEFKSGSIEEAFNELEKYHRHPLQAAVAQIKQNAAGYRLHGFFSHNKNQAPAIEEQQSYKPKKP